MAIERVGASVASQAGMVGPVFTIALGALLLGEPLTVWVVLGTVLVMLGVALLTRVR
jgi:drug/metabolite transporter (DMT)-like permease